MNFVYVVANMSSFRNVSNLFQYIENCECYGTCSAVSQDDILHNHGFDKEQTVIYSSLEILYIPTEGSSSTMFLFYIPI